MAYIYMGKVPDDPRMKKDVLGQAVGYRRIVMETCMQ